MFPSGEMQQHGEGKHVKNNVNICILSDTRDD